MIFRAPYTVGRGTRTVLNFSDDGKRKRSWRRLTAKRDAAHTALGIPNNPFSRTARLSYHVVTVVVYAHMCVRECDTPYKALLLSIGPNKTIRPCPKRHTDDDTCPYNGILNIIRSINNHYCIRHVLRVMLKKRKKKLYYKTSYTSISTCVSTVIHTLYTRLQNVHITRFIITARNI